MSPGRGLVLRRVGSLGETLDSLPGVSGTHFGPDANRPVIRGQDGDRIRVPNDAGASLDASSLSFDHAVPIDRLVVERIEVLRGLAALIHGGSAVGGVVNAIDDRIPRVGLVGSSGAQGVRANTMAGSASSSAGFPIASSCPPPANPTSSTRRAPSFRCSRSRACGPVSTDWKPKRAGG